MTEHEERFVTASYETNSGGISQKRFGEQPGEEIGYLIYGPDDPKFPNMIKIWRGARTFWVPRERLVALEMNL